MHPTAQHIDLVKLELFQSLIISHPCNQKMPFLLSNIKITRRCGCRCLLGPCSQAESEMMVRRGHDLALSKICSSGKAMYFSSSEAGWIT